MYRAHRSCHVPWYACQAFCKVIAQMRCAHPSDNSHTRERLHSIAAHHERRSTTSKSAQSAKSTLTGSDTAEKPHPTLLLTVTSLDQKHLTHSMHQIHIPYIALLHTHSTDLLVRRSQTGRCRTQIYLVAQDQQLLKRVSGGISPQRT